MREYGENGHLMLTEELVFGDVSYESGSMGEMIQKRHMQTVRAKSMRTTEKSWNFTMVIMGSRFIEMAKKDGII